MNELNLEELKIELNKLFPINRTILLLFKLIGFMIME